MIRFKKITLTQNLNRQINVINIKATRSLFIDLKFKKYIIVKFKGKILKLKSYAVAIS